MIPIRISIGVLLVTAMAACGGSSYNTPAPTSPSTPSTPAAVTVSILPSARTLGTAAFVPNPVTISAGTTLTWSNTDSTSHDMVSDSGIWNSGIISPGGRYDFAFQSRGTFPYHCSIHGFAMSGTVVVQ